MQRLINGRYRLAKHYYHKYLSTLNNEDNLELPECINYYLHESHKDIYPPVDCLTKDKVYEYINPSQKSADDSNKIKISFSSKIQDILNSNKKLSLTDLHKISSDIYYEENNWKEPNEDSLDYIKTILPDFKLDGLKSKYSPLSEIKTDFSKKSDKISFGNVYELMDSHFVAYSLGRDWYLSGLPFINDFTTSIDCINNLSINNPERVKYLYDNPWLRYDSYKGIELLFRSFKHYKDDDYFRLTPVNIDYSIFSKSKIIRLLINANGIKLNTIDDEFKTTEKYDSLINLLIDKFNDECLNILVRRIPYINKWKNISVKKLHNAFPRMSQYHALDNFYACQVVANIILNDCKKMISPLFEDLAPLLHQILDLDSLMKFECHNYNIEYNDDKFTYFKIYYTDNTAIDHRVPKVDSNIFSTFLDFHQISSVLFDDSNRIQYAITEIDHIYIYIQKCIGYYLTDYCIKRLNYLKKHHNATYNFIYKRFKIKQNLRNFLIADIFLTSLSLRKTCKKMGFNGMSLRRLLTNNNLICEAFKKHPNKKLYISPELYKTLIESKFNCAECMLPHHFYKTLDDYFNNRFPRIYHNYIIDICQHLARLPSKRLYMACFNRLYNKNDSS